MGLDERSWLCSGPEIWPKHFFYQLKSESEGVDPLGGRAYIFILIMWSSRTSGPTSDVPTLTSGPRRAQPRRSCHEHAQWLRDLDQPAPRSGKQLGVYGSVFRAWCIKCLWAFAALQRKRIMHVEVVGKDLCTDIAYTRCARAFRSLSCFMY